MGDITRLIELSIDGKRFRLAGKIAVTGGSSGDFLVVGAQLLRTCPAQCRRKRAAA